MKVKVYAKLNLSLNVYPRQGEFHHIDSVVTSVNVFDVVSVLPSRGDGVSVTCDADISPAQNSAYRAATAFQKIFGTGGCKIGIKKGIPMGAGLGGSSADAAAVVYCLCALNRVSLDDERVHSLCAALGSDVNFMLRGGLARLTGKGDDVQWSSLCAPLYFALTTFPTQMSTAEVYSAFDGLPKKRDIFCDNHRLLSSLTNGWGNDVVSLEYGNMLQPAACSISDWARGYLDFCAERERSCTMTGSGSAFFTGCFDKGEAKLVACLLNKHGFTTQVCHSVPRGIERTLF